MSELSLSYNKRSGVESKEQLGQILRDPEFALTPERRDELGQFARGLFEGKVGELTVETDRSLKDLAHFSVASTQEEFYPDYFYSDEAGEDKAIMGDNRIMAGLQDIERINYDFTQKQRKEIAARSRDWFKDRLAEALKNDPQSDGEFAGNPGLTVSYNPDKLLEKFGDLQKYRSFYQVVKKQVKDTGDEAKRVVLECYTRRVNGLVAELYPSVFALAEQLESGEDSEKTREWKGRLASCAPVVAHFYDQETTDQAHRMASFDRFAQRLDSFRNGAELRGQKFMPISTPLLDYAENIHHNVPPEAKLPKEVIEKLDTIMFSPEQTKQLTSSVISEWGMLSQYEASWEEVDERSGPAPDGKFQVVITPKRKALAVYSDKRAVYIPQTLDRTLTQASPAGILLVVAHELAHVRQAEFDRKLSEQIPLAEVKGRQYITVSEAGGKYQERQILENYLGRPYVANLHYLRALERKLEGGNILQVARAFYDSYTAQNNPQNDPGIDNTARDLAADRVLRLYRFGGHNSQPLDYIEQELIVEQLLAMSEQERSTFLLTAGSFNLQDTAALRKIGMLELPGNVDIDPAGDVMRVFMRDFYPSMAS